MGFNTGNPIGSKDILDLYDNSENIDHFANSQQDEIPDRFGVKRLTLAGLIKRSMALRNEINDFSGTLTFKPEWSDVPMNVSEGVGGEGGALNLQAEALGNRSEINKITSREALRRTYLEIGLTLVAGSFEAGGNITSSTDVLLQESTGKAYSYTGTYPKTVVAGTNPVSAEYAPKDLSQLRTDLLTGALFMQSGRFALRDIVSVDDFQGIDDTAKFAAAFSYLTTTYGGGEVFVPPKIYNATINLPSNIQLVGTGEKSVIKGITAGTNSYTVKMSNAPIGVDPLGAGGYLAIKNTGVRNLKIDANGSDFGLYMAYCIFIDHSSVTVTNAKVRNLFMGAVYSFSIDKMLLSNSKDVGGSVAENLFSWPSDHQVCNAGSIRRLICYGNGTPGAYNKTTSPKACAGLITGKGINVSFDNLQCEVNIGVGLHVLPTSEFSFNGVYLELNARDGTSDFYQIVNESNPASFSNIHPHFLTSDVFYAAVDTRIHNYYGIRIKGPGEVSLTGFFVNVTVENPRLQTIKLSEVINTDSNLAPSRHNILQLSKDAVTSWSKTQVYEMGVYMIMKSTQTITAGKTIALLPLSSNSPTLTTLPVPPGNYVDGDVIYMKIVNTPNPMLETLSTIRIGYGPGWVGIGMIDVGMYMKLMV